MRKIFFFLAISLLLALSAAAEQKDFAGCKDPALFPNRMPGYFIQKCEHQDFGFFEFYTVKPPRKRIEGEVNMVTYRVYDKQPERSGLEVVRNYENAMKKIGASIQGKDPNETWWVNGVVTVDGKPVWAQAEKGNGFITIRTVKVQDMQQTIVADASAFSKDLKSAGHVAVGGIYFDTASATLKPESAAAIQEIAKMLKAEPGLKVYIVGHTDTVGNLDANLKLSRDRAESVIQALATTHGIQTARLRSFGNGPFAPVASNANEDGRALNRRVELVLQ
jgi:outer membrane protein OmpA-like peptidoglycan-associated protein